VLCNIYPNQEKINKNLRDWTKKIPSKRGITGGIIIVAMESEDDKSLKGFVVMSRPISIRTDRIERIQDSIGDLHPDLMVVEDYSFRQAFNVYKTHPNASAYICFSDQIAVALKHILELKKKNKSQKVLGFDDSWIAQVEKVSSFGQKLDEIGSIVTKHLDQWFSPSLEPTPWPNFMEEMLDVYFVDRD
jgi:hypothetical protein